MTLIHLILPLLLCLGSSAQDEFTPKLCSRSPEPCECQEGLPFAVSCSNFDLMQIPIVEEDNYMTSWALFLEGNKITNVSVIPTQDMLVHLSLSNNQIKVIADGAFVNLPELKILDLSHNYLTKDSLTRDAFIGSFNSDDRHSPIGLESLDLSYNGIDNLDPHAFNHLAKLKTLTMTDNNMYDLTVNMLKAFTELQDIEVLDLSRNQLLRLPDHFVSGMRNLRRLLLSGNRFTTVPQDINFAKSLSYVNLDNNPFKSINMKNRFHTSTTLTEISISHSPTLSLVDQGSFGELSNLTILWLHHNPKLTYISKSAFNGTNENTALKELYLQSNQLSTLYEGLLPWQQLRIVNLQDNPWHCDCRLEWFIKGPLINTSFHDPSLTNEICCSTPASLKGTNINILVAEQYVFQCPNPDASVFRPLIAVTIFIGLLLLVFGTVLFAYLVYKKIKDDSSLGQTIHYRRAKDIDFETIS